MLKKRERKSMMVKTQHLANWQIGKAGIDKLCL